MQFFISALEDEKLTVTDIQTYWLIQTEWRFYKINIIYFTGFSVRICIFEFDF